MRITHTGQRTAGHARPRNCHKEVFLESQKTRRTVADGHLISKTRSWNQSIRSTKARLCSEVTLKDDSGFTRRARFVCVSNHSRKSNGCHCRLIVQEKQPTQHQFAQVKLEDVPKLLKIQKSECPDEWLRLPRHKWPQSWSNIEYSVGPLEKNLYGPTCFLWDRQFEEVPTMMEKYRIGNVCSFTENKDYSNRYMWMTSK